MSDLARKLKVDLRPPVYAGRACGTCRHYDRRGDAFYSGCRFHSGFANTARLIAALCGPDGKNWEPTPPKLGLFGRIRQALFGSK